MGSIMMHLAISNKLKDLIEIKDVNRFLIGSILPDGVTSNYASKSNSHYKIILDNEKKTFDLNGFRIEFKDEILSDDLYLGYYLHLVQDLVNRIMVYDNYNWDPKFPGKVEKLHNDYALLNPYLVEKYKVVNNLKLPKSFENEEINKIHLFKAKDLVEELKYHFQPYDKGDIFFFTKSMVDEYIERCIDACTKELERFKNNEPLLEILTYTW